MTCRYKVPESGVAVIGMAGRFPGAKNIHEFWENLVSGKEFFSSLSHQECIEAGVDPRLTEHPNYVKVKDRTLEDKEFFDAAFFGYLPAEARVMSPQVRIFHECAWNVLEDAGYASQKNRGLIGVYAGASANLHWEVFTTLNGLEKGGANQFLASLLMDKTYLCAHLSYKLNLTGPAVFVHTACSTSLVAIHTAAQALLNGECDIALAGGVTVSSQNEPGYLYQEGMINSPDGRCRAFDAGAGGTVSGEGVGIVALKRLEEAALHRDYIYAVIRGSAINNDGNRKVGFTAPSIEGQAETIKTALLIAEVEPESIDYIETHGTGTPLGDPVEVEGLKLAFNTTRMGFCAIGSVKTNIGHADAAAGAAGFIKTVMALRHRLIPPSLNFEQPNPKIDLIDSPFYVNTEAREWENHHYPLRAGVSSFGLGGTNAHVVLEEWPDVHGTGRRKKDQQEQGSDGISLATESRKYRLILLSAKTETALERMSQNLARYFQKNPGINLADAAYTLQVGREDFDYRKILLCSSIKEAIQGLFSPGMSPPGNHHHEEIGKKISGLSPGTPYINQGRQPYRHKPVFHVKPPGRSEIEMKEQLIKAGWRWLYGQESDWTEFYKQEKPYRVSLPGYSFDRQYYQVGESPLEEDLVKKGMEMIIPSSRQLPSSIADWLYVPQWTGSFYPDSSGFESPDQTFWLFFMDLCGLGVAVVEQLQKKLHQVVTVRSGEKFVKINPSEFEIDPAKDSDYDRLFRELTRLGRVPDRVVHLWTVTNQQDWDPGIDKFKVAQVMGLYSLLSIARAIENRKIGNEIEITVITNHLQDVTQEELLCPEKATVLAPVKVIPQEYPSLVCRCIDVILPEPGTLKQGDLIHQLLTELTAKSSHTVIAYRGQRRWVERFESIKQVTVENKGCRLKEKGVYVLIGGLGEIGLLLAGYLARSVKAKLVLTGRSTPGELQVQTLRQLEEAGAEVLVLTAEVTHRQQMEAVFSRAEKRFGKINGVIYSAGIPAGETFRPIKHISSRQMEEQYQTKVYGLWVLESVLQDKAPDFCLLVSSLSAILGGLEFCAYAAANIYMDAFVKAHNRTSPFRWITVDWDKMDAHRTLEAFQCILSLERVYQVVTSNGGYLQARIDNWIKLESIRGATAPVEGPLQKEKSLLRQRPELSTPYLAPAGESEQVLTRIWQEMFGIARIGANDDFFELGGDSLKAIILTSTIHKELNVIIPLGDLFQQPTIRGMAGYIDSAVKSEYVSLEPAEKKDGYPLSSAQQRLYLLQQLDAGNTPYNIPLVHILKGKVDKEKLERAVKQVIERHEAFRTGFRLLGEDLVQVICSDVEFEIEYDNLAAEKRGKPGKWDSFVRPFDLSHPPLLRMKLVRRSPEEYVLLSDIHHIISDAVSLEILVADFTGAYAGRKLEPLKLQYKDFVVWQRSEVGQGELARQEKYWLEQFRGEIPVLNLPTDHPRPPIQSFQGAGCGFVLNETLTGGLKRLCEKYDVTIYMILLAVYKVLLSKYSGAEEIIVGSPVVGRSHMDLENIMGVFMNTLAIRSYPEGMRPFDTFLRELKHITLEAFDNQDYPFEELVNKVNIQRDVSRNPLFDTMFSLQNVEIHHLQMEEIEVLQGDVELKTARFDLTLNVVEKDGSIRCGLEYSTKLFNRETVEKLGRHFQQIVKDILENPQKLISTVHILGKQELHQLLDQFNETTVEYPEKTTLLQLFAKNAEENPDSPAVIFENSLLTYGELNTRGNQLANHLVSIGIGLDKPVGVYMERSLGMIVALLGVLKANGAYIPMDPFYPSQRLELMKRDAQFNVVLTREKLLNRLPGKNLQVICLDTHWTKIASGSDTPPLLSLTTEGLAYVIYTSGSTGIPKGVSISYEALNNFLHSMAHQPGIKRVDLLLSVTTLSFDISGLEFYLPLLVGARLVLASQEEIVDGRRLMEKISKHEITIMQATPTTWYLMLAAGFQGNRRLKMLCGGEAMPPDLAVQLAGKGESLWNMYGPTETTIWSSIAKIEDQHQNPVTIGGPIANTRIYILDPYLNPVPLKVPGQLFIGGAGLARGYLNRPELTAQKFQIPNKPGHHRSNRSYKSYILYRTGDLARWLPDGNIECLGRMDSQVKVRGYRIELGEIESALGQYPAVQESVAIAWENETAPDDKRISAYMVLKPGEEVVVNELREFLLKKIPAYMVPSAFVMVDQLPLLPNGKVDRKKLSRADIYRPQLNVEYREPATELEKYLVEIWTNLLKINTIGIHDNFFDLGGNSLLLVRMQAMIDKSYPGRLAVVDLFSYSTIAKLANFLQRGEETIMQDITLEGIDFPPQYFTTGPETNESRVFKIKIESDLYEGLAAIAGEYRIELPDILFSLAAYLYSQISGKSRILTYVMNHDDRVFFLPVDFNGVQETETLFKRIADKRQQHETLKQGGFPLCSLKRKNLNTAGHTIISLLMEGSEYASTAELLTIFDILLCIHREKNSLSLSWEYDEMRIRKEKVEEMLTAYVNLLESL